MQVTITQTVDAASGIKEDGTKTPDQAATRNGPLLVVAATILLVLTGILRTPEMGLLPPFLLMATILCAASIPSLSALWTQRAAIKKLSMQQVVLIMLSACSGSVLFSIFSMLALTPSHVILRNLTGAMIIQRLQPALLFLIAVLFLRQKPRWHEYTALASLVGASYLGLFGFAPISTSADGFNTASLVYSGLAICCGAIGTVTSKMAAKDINAIVLSSLRLITAAVLVLVLTAIAESHLLSFEQIGPSLLVDWWRYVIIGIVYFFSLILYYHGVKTTRVASIAIAEAAVTVVTPLLILGVASSASSLWTIVALALATTAIVLTARIKS